MGPYFLQFAIHLPFTWEAAWWIAIRFEEPAGLELTACAYVSSFMVRAVSTPAGAPRVCSTELKSIGNFFWREVGSRHADASEVT